MKALGEWWTPLIEGDTCTNSCKRSGSHPEKAGCFTSPQTKALHYNCQRKCFPLWKLGEDKCSWKQIPRLTDTDPNTTHSPSEAMCMAPQQGHLRFPMALGHCSCFQSVLITPPPTTTEGKAKGITAYKGHPNLWGHVPNMAEKPPWTCPESSDPFWRPQEGSFRVGRCKGSRQGTEVQMWWQ